jgi:hypothetical protein
MLPPAIIPFHLNPTQYKLHLLWERLLKEIGFIRIIVLKARRQGVSTYTEGRLFHQTTTNHDTHSFIIAHDKDGLNTIFNMSKLFWEKLPTQLRPMIRYSSKTELVFENPNAKRRLINPGLRSRIEVFSANKVTASRSGGYTIAHFSEVPFYDDAETLMTATVPSIPDGLGTVKVLEGTANGRGDFFHSEWLKAKSTIKNPKKRKLSNYTPIFFSYLDFPDYSTPFLTPEYRAQFIDGLDDEEKALLQKYHASMEQLNWRRDKIVDFGGDLDYFHQEYPVDDEEAFISGGVCYFPRDRLRKMRQLTIPPLKVGEITQDGFQENDTGPLSIWELPQPGYDYVVGGDVGLGTEDSDYSVLEVLKIPKGVPIIEQVAEWHDHCDPVVFAGKMALLCQFYNEALAIPEINNHGFTTLTELKHLYWNIYRWQYFDRFGNFVTNKLGWDTNVSTRPLLCDYTLACINCGILMLHGEELINECLSFVKRPSGGGEGDTNCFDDRVMAFMIALFCLGHNYETQSLLKQVGVFTDPVVEKVGKRVDIKRVNSVDHDNFDWEGGDGVGVDDRAWMNY